jgi:monofunctional biosynthetic peptidoglycan transglycosylase
MPGRGLVRLVARVALAAMAISIAAVALGRFVDPPITPLMVIRVGEALAAGRPVHLERSWVPLRAVSGAAVRAVVAGEDARFFVHRGVDVAAVREALTYNAHHPRARPRGASTITMQCARNVFLWPGRSWVRKALETWFAVLLELVWGKARILEVYLNVAEWGDGVYGIDAAARRSFGVSAAQLGPHEAALLAAALPNPRRRNPASPSASLAAHAARIESRAAGIRLPPAFPAG